MDNMDTRGAAENYFASQMACFAGHVYFSFRDAAAGILMLRVNYAAITR